MIESPQSFGKYTLLERLAAGGMAEIFKARMVGLSGFERIVAIKRLHAHLGRDPELMQMLVDEAKIAVQLRHSNIGQVFDLGQIGDQYFIVMEYIDGVDLAQMARRTREQEVYLPIPFVLHAVARTLSALEYAHTRRDGQGQPMRIIHRDVSPQNVMVSHEGEFKLIDFGIAKAKRRAVKTQAGIIKGKFFYMAPEQAHGHDLDHRVDVFAAGMVLYELLCGRPAYEEADDLTLLKRIRAGQFERPTRWRPDLDPELEAIIMRALAVQRDERFESAWAFQNELEGFIQRRVGAWSPSQVADVVVQVMTSHKQPLRPKTEPQHVMRRDDYRANDDSLLFRTSDLAALLSEDTRAEGGEATSLFDRAHLSRHTPDAETNPFAAPTSFDQQPNRITGALGALGRVIGPGRGAGDFEETDPIRSTSADFEATDPVRTSGAFDMPGVRMSGGFDAPSVRMSGGFDQQDLRTSGAFDQQQNPRISGAFEPMPSPRATGGFAQQQDLRRSGGFDQQQDLRRSGGFDQQQDLRRSGAFDQQQDLRRSGGFAQQDLRMSGGFDQQDLRMSGGFDQQDLRVSGGFDAPQELRISGDFEAVPRSPDPMRVSGGFEAATRQPQPALLGAPPVQHSPLDQLPGWSAAPHSTSPPSRSETIRKRIDTLPAPLNDLRVFAATIVVATLATVFMGWMLLSSPAPTELPPDTPPAPKVTKDGKVEVVKATLPINSKPTGARVYIDGALAGSTPLAVPDLTSGKRYTVELRKDNYPKWEQTVLLANPPEALVVDLDSLRRTEGVLDIRTTPPGLTIEVDGVQAGRSPAKRQQVDMNVKHTVLAIQRDGTMRRQVIEWKEGDANVKVVTFDFSTEDPGDPHATGPIDPHANTPRITSRRRPSSTRRRPSTRRSSTTTERLNVWGHDSHDGNGGKEEPKERLNVWAHATAKPGYLTVEVLGASASVYIDGKLISDSSPVRRYSLEPGLHKIKVFYKEQKSFSEIKSVRVRPNSEARVNFEP